MQRFVRKDRRIYAHSTCRLCGVACGVVAPEIECRATECLACSSRQCMTNGLGHGTCGICYVGLLPGWSGNVRACDYEGCTHAAIARVDGANRYRCREHLERGKWFGYVASQLLRRDAAWQLVDESPCSPYAPRVAAA